MKCLKDAAGDRGARAIDAAGTPNVQEASSSRAVEEVVHTGAATALIPRVVPGLVSKWTGSVTSSVVFFGKIEAAQLVKAVQVDGWPAKQWEDLGSIKHAYDDNIKYCYVNWKQGTDLDLGSTSDRPGLSDRDRFRRE